MTQERIDEFWKHVDKRDIDDCWPWMAGHDTLGYGVFQVQSTKGWNNQEKRNIKCIRVHRIAFTLSNGCEPLKHVCHKCDNPPCCNPAHLFDGSHKDNAVDMWKKGRAHIPHRMLTPEQVLEIQKIYPMDRPRSRGRARHKDPTPQYKEIATRYGVNVSTIERIANRRNWFHINHIE
jgi:hypothetical protein